LIRVETGAGKLEGVEQNGVQVFKGVPYAKPPTGDLRLRAPRPVESWTGVRSAQEFGALAPQNPPPSLFGNAAEGPQSEDCLTLNVWTPSTTGSRSVLVWMHGGAFIFGTGASPLYNGAKLASRGDVVVVTINYRLGILGYLAHPDLEDENGARGNWGLLDQLAALRWVRQNIAAFGGDPNNVTAFGESAGALSVADLLTVPSAKGLLHRAIIQSGPPFAASIESAGEVAAKILRHLGIDDPTKVRDVPVEALLAAQAAIVGTRGAGRLPLIPAIDAATLPTSPGKALADGAAAGIPVLIGTNRDEFKIFIAADPDSRAPDEAVVRAKIERAFKANGVELDPGDVIDGYRSARAARGASITPRDLWSAIESDRMFRVNSMLTAEALARHEQRTFTYLFTWESPALDGTLGASHAVELPFVFGNLSAPRMDMFGGSGPKAEALSETMMDAWLAFARSGNPSTPRHDAWPAYEPGKRATMILGSDVHVENAPDEAERKLWEAAAAARSGR